eukprot:1653807-Rhodomonas_salina.1
MEEYKNAGKAKRQFHPPQCSSRSSRSTRPPRWAESAATCRSSWARVPLTAPTGNEQSKLSRHTDIAHLHAPVPVTSGWFEGGAKRLRCSPV